MAERNKAVPEGRRMLFRVGINQGDVIHDDDTHIYGDGINMSRRASRPSAEPSGVYITGKVHRGGARPDEGGPSATWAKRSCAISAARAGVRGVDRGAQGKRLASCPMG